MKSLRNHLEFNHLGKSTFKRWQGEGDPEKNIRIKYYQREEFQVGIFPLTVSNATERYKKMKS